MASGVFTRGLDQYRIQPGSVQGRGCRLRSVCRCLNLSRTQTGSLQGPRCGLRSVYRRLEPVQDPTWCSAGTDMLAQECLSGSCTKAQSSLVQCRDREVRSGVFVGGLNKCRTQPGSELGPRCWLRNGFLGLDKGRTQPGSVQEPRCGLRSICWGMEQG